MSSFTTLSSQFAQLPTAVIWHLGFALTALVLGPFALWSRKGSRQHRALGYLWVLVMLSAAISSLFIREFRMPNIAGFGPIHLLTLATFFGIGSGLWFISQRRISAHQRSMRGTYIGGCLIAGLFTLLPGRFLGQALWHSTLGLI